MRRMCKEIAWDWAAQPVPTMHFNVQTEVERREADDKRGQAAAAERAEAAAAQLLQEEQAAAEAQQRAKEAGASRKSKKARQKQRKQVCCSGCRFARQCSRSLQLAVADKLCLHLCAYAAHLLAGWQLQRLHCRPPHAADTAL